MKFDNKQDDGSQSVRRPFFRRSKRLLGLIFGRPDRSFYTSEIVRAVQSGTGAVVRELSRLQASGLVSVEKIGNQKHYRANRESPVFNELRSLILKTVGLKEPLREALEPYADRIRFAFVYGSVAKQTDTARSDIDLMVIGEDLDYSDLYSRRGEHPTVARERGAESIECFFADHASSASVIIHNCWKRALSFR
jgi:hypothetical protein